MASAQVCPVVGTTNSILPPSHPSVDLDQPGQTCPVTNATTDHHHTLAQHPKVPIPDGTSAADATACPVLERVVSQPQSKAMDDKICPVVGPSTRSSIDRESYKRDVPGNEGNLIAPQGK
ncbi:hypothetical protein LTR05_002744 [Lithohypha guttulata]|uniref:Uncharacterized protein n=1 Tax=Lithohypha guttulata TaxID=1690604 RepID=A0AAN7T3R4_9EURO|nr:hypothetical protein LTR05_002744 [Lithohypha guttulata]